MIGYNNINYDNVLAQAFLESELKGLELVTYLYDATQPIFNERENQSEVQRLRRSYIIPNSDIMSMYFQSGFQKPLKMLGVMLFHNLIYEGNIQSKRDYSLEELGYKSLNDLFEDKKMYNINDILITDKFFSKLDKEWNTRIRLSELFKIDFYSDSESSIANKLVLRLYATAVSKVKDDELILRKEAQLRGRTTRREKVYFKDAIVNCPSFETKYLNHIKESILNSYWTPEYNFNKVIHIGNVIGKVGVGGIHLFNTKEERNYEYLLNNVPSEIDPRKLKSVQVSICYKNIPKGKSVREIDVALNLMGR